MKVYALPATRTGGYVVRSTATHRLRDGTLRTNHLWWHGATTNGELTYAVWFATRPLAEQALRAVYGSVPAGKAVVTLAHARRTEAQ